LVSVSLRYVGLLRTYKQGGGQHGCHPPALELGVTFLDTSDIYGPFTNEELVGVWGKVGWSHT
jgi:aryl-alcohol dehydrogenase-like predicted oxidoreductase